MLKRLAREWDAVQPLNHVKVLAARPDVSSGRPKEPVEWQVIMFIEPPPSSPYAGMPPLDLVLKFPLDYPFKPPRMTVHCLYHPCLFSFGNFCDHFMRDTWSPALSVMKVLEHLQHLICNVETLNFAKCDGVECCPNPSVYNDLKDNPYLFRTLARRSINKMQMLLSPEGRKVRNKTCRQSYCIFLCECFRGSSSAPTDSPSICKVFNDKYLCRFISSFV